MLKRPFESGGDPQLRSLRERHERLTAGASEAWANLEQARKGYGAEPTTAQTRALETMQAEYDRTAAESTGAESEYRDALSRYDGSGTGTASDTACGARRIGELRSYGRGDDLRAKMRADGPTLGEIVRSMVTGRAISGYSLLSSGVSGALPDYEVLGIVGQALQESVIFSAGARVVPMDAPSVKLARVTSTPDIEIKPEADDRDLTDQAIGFTPVSMDANSAFLYGTTTLEAVEDVANLEETITGIFSRQLARAWDKYALGGDGNGEPLGLGYMFAADGVSEVDADAEAPLASYAKLIEAVGRVRAQHHNPTAVVLDVPSWATLAMLTATDDQPLVPPKAYSDLGEYVSDFVSLGAGSTSNAVVGDFSRLLVGVRTNVQVEVNTTGPEFKQGKVAIRARMRWGSFVDDPSAFAVVRNLHAVSLAPDES